MNKINLMLHAHQPYVRHLEYEKFLEEDWLYEALNESYIPLLRMLRKLDDDNIDYRFSICFSPTLVSMLEDEPLRVQTARTSRTTAPAGFGALAGCRGLYKHKGASICSHMEAPFAFGQATAPAGLRPALS